CLVVTLFSSMAPSRASFSTLSLHDALPILLGGGIVPGAVVLLSGEPGVGKSTLLLDVAAKTALFGAKDLYVTGEDLGSEQRRLRSEEHTSELQSRFDLVCRLLLEKKNNNSH